MTCKGAVAKLSEYLDGELSGYDMLAIRNHLNSCAGCEREFADLRQLKWMVSNLIEEQPGEDFSARLKTNVFAAAKASSRKRIPVAMMTSLAFTTAVLI